MLKQRHLYVGCRVRYQPAHYGVDKWENGMVKEIPTHRDDAVRVVYNCNGKWDRFSEYTSAMTYMEDLRMGWMPNGK